NVADGAVAVITPVSVDHAEYLGDTVAAIAADKAGIIKAGAVAVIGQQPVDAAAPLLRRAAAGGASVAREGIEVGLLSRGAWRGGAGARHGGTRRGVPGAVPAAVRRAPSGERRLRAGRGRGILRRGRLARRKLRGAARGDRCHTDAARHGCTRC